MKIIIKMSYINIFREWKSRGILNLRGWNIIRMGWYV